MESDGILRDGTDRRTVLRCWHRGGRICAGSDGDHGHFISAFYTAGCTGDASDTGGICVRCPVSDPDWLWTDENAVICDQRKFWRDPVLLYGTGFRECFGDDRSGQGREDTESEISCRRADAESGDDDYHHRVCHGSGDCSCGAETGSGICMEYCHTRRRYGIHACYDCRRDFP